MDNYKKLIITREKKFWGSALKFDVFVDGVKIGVLKNGCSVTVFLTTGFHQIVFKKWKSIVSIISITVKPEDVNKYFNASIGLSQNLIVVESNGIIKKTKRKVVKNFLLWFVYTTILIIGISCLPGVAKYNPVTNTNVIPVSVVAISMLLAGILIFISEQTKNKKLSKRKKQEPINYPKVINTPKEKPLEIQPELISQPEMLIPSEPTKQDSTPFDIIRKVDDMDGHLFENWCADLLLHNGFSSATVTPGSGDHGVDIVAEKDDIRYAIQCKRYHSDLGNTPVQEVFAGKEMYKCQVGVVMTNQHFTAGAKALAEQTRVLLWDRDKLLSMIEHKAT